jgi:hypothetical protein
MKFVLRLVRPVRTINPRRIQSVTPGIAARPGGDKWVSRAASLKRCPSQRLCRSDVAGDCLVNRSG